MFAKRIRKAFPGDDGTFIPLSSDTRRMSRKEMRQFKRSIRALSRDPAWQAVMAWMRSHP